MATIAAIDVATYKTSSTNYSSKVNSPTGDNVSQNPLDDGEVSVSKIPDGLSGGQGGSTYKYGDAISDEQAASDAFVKSEGLDNLKEVTIATRRLTPTHPLTIARVKCKILLMKFVQME